MKPSPSSKAVTLSLVGLALIAGAIALVSVFIGVAYGLGPIGAMAVFVGYAVVISGVSYGWHRFASRLR